jgi:Family of unknown function (DUF6262)
MTTEAKIVALKGAAERKRQDALKRTNQAITKLVKSGQKITFVAVAEAAGVSVAYLYKYDDLKERIAHLKAQQEGKLKPIKPQAASDKSKQVIITQLRERIKKLETENQRLRQQNEAIYGRLCQLQVVQEQVEALKLQNTSLKTENDWLKQQSAQSRPDSENAISFLATASPPVSLPAIRETARSEIPASVQAALAKVGLQLNPTLSRTIRTVPEATVLKAIDALQEAMAAGTIERPGGWLKRAIEESWQPNETSSPQLDPDISLFNQWFDLARTQGIVAASLQGEDGQMWVFDREGVRYAFEQMLVMHPLEQLKG